MIRLRSGLPARLAYLVLAAALIASQHILVWFVVAGRLPTALSIPEFWFTPLKIGLATADLTPSGAAMIFVYGLAVAWGLALLSFKQAKRIARGYFLALLSAVPGVQLAAIPMLAVLPAAQADDEPDRPSDHYTSSVTLGLLAGITLVVLAVLISAVTFGAYGWGLFVMTPFLVGVTTGFLVNRQKDLGGRRTMVLGIEAAGLGSLALVILALEGVVCILLAAPLAIPMVMLGAALGRAVAVARLTKRNPLPSVAVLPLIFVLEAATPSKTTIATAREIAIEAPPAAVWAALISAEPIRVKPSLTAAAGLAYPIAGQLQGEGIGAMRSGAFSTGVAREVVTEWKPEQSLAFRILGQPPAMEEMSPYRRVHAPHVVGYFETGETRFRLLPLAGGGTRLRVTSKHRLRIDPVPYWEPIARWAIADNVDRVLQDVRLKALDMRR